MILNKTLTAPGKEAQPSNETERLLALHRYRLLDTSPEHVFDEITSLAATLYGMPISLVTLIDRDRQWFKSRHGFKAAWTRRDIAFCSHTILDRCPHIVVDAAADERFLNNPLVTADPNIRFYAGVPLVSPEGFALGTLCVIDTVPHPEFAAEQIGALRKLADLVMLAIEARSLTFALRDEVENHLNTEAQLRRALAEQHTLLREVHHRVKNNLQAMWGLVQFEASRLRHNTEASERLDRIAQRISVLGGIHEQLYGANEYSSVNTADHLVRLTRIVASDHSQPLPEDAIRVDAEPLCCDLDTALPLGLIAHELISNAVRYAGEPEAGMVHVSFGKSQDGDGVLLTVQEPRSGSEPDPCRKGIGLTLVDLLAGQIEATVTRDTTAGWTTTVAMPAGPFHPPHEGCLTSSVLTYDDVATPVAGVAVGYGG
jgi:two-component sensor histidine kinase